MMNVQYFGGGREGSFMAFAQGFVELSPWEKGEHDEIYH